MLPSFPMDEFPILGFQGDGVGYDVNSGITYDPANASGPGCGAGCSGETPADARSMGAVTLGRFLRARGDMQITLVGYQSRIRAYTAARFDFKFRDLLPNSIYTFWALRDRIRTGRMPNALGMLNGFTTDGNGNADFTTTIENPFPASADDPSGMRIFGIEVAFHPDYNNWGACPAKLAPAVDVLAVFDTVVGGMTDITSFVTKAAPRAD